MPLIRDAHTRPIRCPAHVWDDVATSRCPNCGLINDRADYGFTGTPNNSATPIGSPYLQTPKISGTYKVKAGHNALPVGMSVVNPPRTGQNGWIRPNLPKNASKRPTNV